MRSIESPKLSICVMAYNQEKFIRQCLQSIVDQKLNVTYEVVIGDDCSSDATVSIIENEFLKKYPDNFLLIRQPSNSGGIKSYLDIYSAARGQYLSHMDGDDVMLPGKLQAQVDFLDQNSECSIVAHNVRTIDQFNNVVSESFRASPTKKVYSVEELIQEGTFFTHSSKMLRRSSLVKRMRSGFTADFLFHIEHAMSGHVGYIDLVLGEYRLGVGVSSVSGIHKRGVLEGHLEAYKYARDSGIDEQLVNAAEINFRYVQGMMALRAGRYDLFRFLFSGGKPSSIFSRYNLFALLRRVPSVAHGFVRLFDRLRGN